MINKKQAIEVLNECLATGADYAEIYIEETNSKSYATENGKVDSASVSKTHGAGIRLLNDLQSVYGYTNNIEKNGLLSLAKSLAASFNGEQRVKITNLKVKKVKNNHPHLRPYDEVSDEEKIAYLKKGDEAMNIDEKIVRRAASLAHYTKKVTLINSKGFIFKDEKERGRLSLSCIAKDGDKIETAYEGPGASAGFEYLENSIDPAE